MRKQSGFSVIELTIVVLMVAVIATAGWVVYHKKQTNKPLSSGTNSSDSMANDVSATPQIKTASDLDNALKVLDQNDPTTANTGDNSQLSSQSSF